MGLDAAAPPREQSANAEAPAENSRRRRRHARKAKSNVEHTSDDDSDEVDELADEHEVGQTQEAES